MTDPAVVEEALLDARTSLLTQMCRQLARDVAQPAPGEVFLSLSADFYPPGRPASGQGSDPDWAEVAQWDLTAAATGGLPREPAEAGRLAEQLLLPGGQARRRVVLRGERGSGRGTVCRRVRRRLTEAILQPGTGVGSDLGTQVVPLLPVAVTARGILGAIRAQPVTAASPRPDELSPQERRAAPRGVLWAALQTASGDLGIAFGEGDPNHAFGTAADLDHWLVLGVHVWVNGLDELSGGQEGHGERDEVAKWLDALLAGYPRVRAVVCDRVHLELPERLRSFDVVVLRDLTEDTTQTYLEEVLQLSRDQSRGLGRLSDRDAARSLATSLRDGGQLGGLPRRPLPLRMLAEHYVASDPGDLGRSVRNVGDIYWAVANQALENLAGDEPLNTPMTRALDVIISGRSESATVQESEAVARLRAVQAPDPAGIPTMMVRAGLLVRQAGGQLVLTDRARLRIRKLRSLDQLAYALVFHVGDLAREEAVQNLVIGAGEERDRVLNGLLQSGLLREEARGAKIVFLHPEIRDYFAARHFDGLLAGSTSPGEVVSALAMAGPSILEFSAANTALARRLVRLAQRGGSPRFLAVLLRGAENRKDLVTWPADRPAWPPTQAARPETDKITAEFISAQRTTLGKHEAGEGAWRAAAQALALLGTLPARRALLDIVRGGNGTAAQARSAALTELVHLIEATPTPQEVEANSTPQESRMGAVAEFQRDSVRPVLTALIPKPDEDPQLRAQAIRAAGLPHLKEKLITLLPSRLEEDGVGTWPVVSAARTILRQNQSEIEEKQTDAYLAACETRLADIDARLGDGRAPLAELDELQHERLDLLDELASAGRFDLVLRHRFAYGIADDLRSCGCERRPTASPTGGPGRRHTAVGWAERLSPPDDARVGGYPARLRWAPSPDLFRDFRDAAGDPLDVAAAGHRVLAYCAEQGDSLVGDVSRDSTSTQLLVAAQAVRSFDSQANRAPIAARGRELIRELTSQIVTHPAADHDLESLAAWISALLSTAQAEKAGSSQANRTDSAHAHLETMAVVGSAMARLVDAGIDRCYRWPVTHAWFTSPWPADDDFARLLLAHGDTGREAAVFYLANSSSIDVAGETRHVDLDEAAAKALEAITPGPGSLCRYIRACVTANRISRGIALVTDPVNLEELAGRSRPHVDREFGYEEASAETGLALASLGYLSLAAREEARIAAGAAEEPSADWAAEQFRDALPESAADAWAPADPFLAALAGSDAPTGESARAFLHTLAAAAPGGTLAAATEAGGALTAAAEAILPNRSEAAGVVAALVPEAARIFLDEFQTTPGGRTDRGRKVGLAVLGDWQPLLDTIPDAVTDVRWQQAAVNAIRWWTHGPCGGGRSPNRRSPVDEAEIGAYILGRLDDSRPGHRPLTAAQRTTFIRVREMLEARVGGYLTTGPPSQA